MEYSNSLFLYDWIDGSIEIINDYMYFLLKHNYTQIGTKLYLGYQPLMSTTN